MAPVAHSNVIMTQKVPKISKPEKAKTAIEVKQNSKPSPKVEAEVNYPELTADIQTRLLKLGFYNGDINGLKNRATKEAITNFKTLFSMSDTSDKITGALLTELKRAEREQEAAALEAQTQAEAEPAAIQFADVTPTASFYDTIQAAPSTPVVTDTLPAAGEFTSDINAEPAYVAQEPQPEPEAVKVASIPTVISEPAPTPALQDVIVDAKVLKKASAKYPSAAQRRNYFVNVAIQVAFDIGTDGRPANLRIISNDHTGKYNEAFEKEAMGAIKKMRYEPKTVNGVAVETKAKQKRIVFRVE
jgi:protein TonB